MSHMEREIKHLQFKLVIPTEGVLRPAVDLLHCIKVDVNQCVCLLFAPKDDPCGS